MKFIEKFKKIRFTKIDVATVVVGITVGFAVRRAIDIFMA